MTLALPKPIREKRTPQPLKRSRPKRAKRPRKQRKTSRGRMGRLADKLFSLIVRQRGCDEHTDTLGKCAGPKQCAHIVSRTYRSVRWSEDNAMCLCAGAHVYYTHHPIEWERLVIAKMERTPYEALKARALVRWDGDIESVLVRLAARAVSLGIKPEGK